MKSVCCCMNYIIPTYNKQIWFSFNILCTYRGKKRSCHNAETIPSYWYINMYNIQMLCAERNNTFIGKCESAFLTILCTYRGKRDPAIMPRLYLYIGTCTISNFYMQKETIPLLVNVSRHSWPLVRDVTQISFWLTNARSWELLGQIWGSNRAPSKLVSMLEG